MHYQFLFITWMALCSMQTIQGANIGYNEDCEVGKDTCTAPGTGCRTENSATKCLCKTDEHWVNAQGNTACECAPTYVLDESTCRATIGTTVCTVSGSECSTATNSYCDASSSRCKCPAIATAGNNICTYTVCNANAPNTCTSLDANSECSGTTCRCKTGQTIGSNGKCSAGIGTTVCTVSGSECSGATDSYCDATSGKCQCPAIATAGTNTCTYKACTGTSAVSCPTLDKNSECSGSAANDKCRCKTSHVMGNEGKCALICKADAVCTVVDPNSECSGTTDRDKCRCKTGYKLGSDGLCAVGSGGGGAAGLLVSVSILLACLLATLF